MPVNQNPETWIRRGSFRSFHTSIFSGIEQYIHFTRPPPSPAAAAQPVTGPSPAAKKQPRRHAVQQCADSAIGARLMVPTPPPLRRSPLTAAPTMPADTLPRRGAIQGPERPHQQQYIARTSLRRRGMTPPVTATRGSASGWAKEGCLASAHEACGRVLDT